jgi:hypothetical protein
VDPAARRWSLPVCVRYGDARTSLHQCTLIEAAETTVPLAPDPPADPGQPGPVLGCPSWVIENADAIGYYRSKVDPAIARQLLTAGSPIARIARPTPAERIMLIEDLRAAVARGELPIDQLLALVPVIAADPDDKVAQNAVRAADIPMAGLDEPTYQAARQWVYRALRGRARELGWQRGPRDSDERELLRHEFVPLIADDDPALATEAARRADRWLVDTTGLPDDLVSAALMVAAHHGDAARFDRYVAAAGDARDRAELTRLTATLGWFTDPALAARALAIVSDPRRDLRNTIAIVYGVLDHRETRDLGLAFVTDHLDDLLARMHEVEAVPLLEGLASSFCDPERRAKIAAVVVARAATIDGAQAAVRRGLERADQCIAEVQRELPALRRTLAAR